MKELKIEVPKGYEIDKENSTFECIKFKEKQEIKTWGDYLRVNKGSGSVHFEEDVRNTTHTINGEEIQGFDKLFRVYFRMADYLGNYNKIKRHIRSFLIINKLMPYYGGVITRDEWRDASMDKYIIKRFGSDVDFSINNHDYHFLAFHTEEQRDEFYNKNKQLAKDYLMID